MWDFFRGIVKGCDTGGIYREDGDFPKISDTLEREFSKMVVGTWYNEQGLPYCMLHQFERGRNSAFFKEMI